MNWEKSGKSFNQQMQDSERGTWDFGWGWRFMVGDSFMVDWFWITVNRNIGLKVQPTKTWYVRYMENEMFNPMFRPRLFEVSRVLWWALTILPNWFPISGCNLFGQITHSLVSSTDIHIGKCDRGFCNFSEPCWPFLNILNGNARALVLFQGVAFKFYPKCDLLVTCHLM